MVHRPSRRRLFAGLAIGAGGVAAGGFLGRAAVGDASPDVLAPDVEKPDADSAAAAPARIPATGEHQAGIMAPANPQPFSLTVVADLEDVADRSFLALLGSELLAFLAADRHDSSDLTVTVGVGPRVVAAVDETLDGAQPLPEFAGDTELTPARTGGDLLLIASAGHPEVLPAAVDALLEVVPGVEERWRQFGFRGPGSDGIVRNPFGFHDGIIVPRGEDDMAEHVWLRDDPRVAGGTIAVIRRLQMDRSGFARLSEEEQEAVVGRKKRDGAPLSGGDQRAAVSLTAKTPDGEYLTPLGSHARAAHPSPTGSALMLRRGYSYADGGEVGLVFTCFQRDLRTFVVTQQRIDEQDRMMEYVTTTASASFLILPGFDGDRPLGSTLG